MAVKPFDESAFTYMEPDRKSYGSHKLFAQCATCRDWTGRKDERCRIHGPKARATWDTTCTLYVNGEPAIGAKTLPMVTVKESGAEKRQVRCENCFYFHRKTKICKLFWFLNQAMKGYAKLREKVHPFGCCDANVPRRTR